MMNYMYYAFLFLFFSSPQSHPPARVTEDSTIHPYIRDILYRILLYVTLKCILQIIRPKECSFPRPIPPPPPSPSSPAKSGGFSFWSRLQKRMGGLGRGRDNTGGREGLFKKGICIHFSRGKHLLHHFSDLWFRRWGAKKQDGVPSWRPLDHWTTMGWAGPLWERGFGSLALFFFFCGCLFPLK